MLICFVIYYITKFYFGLKRYPKGPFPIPILGNFLGKFHYFVIIILNTFISEFFKIKTSVFEHLANLAKKHGGVYTFWMGSQPIVVITDLKAANEGFLVKRNQIAGRPYINVRKY